jgi:hypothetical protein
LFFDDHNEGRVEIRVYPRGPKMRPFATIRGSASAPFGQATYTWSSRVSLTRSPVHEKQKDLHKTVGKDALGRAILNNPASFCDLVESASDHAWTPTSSVEMRYRATGLSTSPPREGFKSEGFNITARESGKAFNPEFGWSYEG